MSDPAAPPDRFGQQNRPLHAVLVMAHPASSSLTRAVTVATAEALERHGYRTETADLVAEGFNPVFGSVDRFAFSSGSAAPEDVRKEQVRIDRADHLILVYPVYWWAMPALLKGWIDRVFIAGWAFDDDPDQGIVKKLGWLKVSLVAIAGADGATYAKRGYREAMRTQIEDGIFDFCGAPVIASQLVTPDQAAQPFAPQKIANAVIARLSAQ